MTQDAAPSVSHRPAPPAFPVVVLAASAGGLPAFGHIFGAFPADFRAALAVVQHRHPRGSGFLAEVLQRFREFWSVTICSGELLLEDAFAACLLQSMDLEVEVLVVGRYSGAVYLHTA